MWTGLGWMIRQRKRSVSRPRMTVSSGCPTETSVNSSRKWPSVSTDRTLTGMAWSINLVRKFNYKLAMCLIKSNVSEWKKKRFFVLRFCWCFKTCYTYWQGAMHVWKGDGNVIRMLVGAGMTFRSLPQTLSTYSLFQRQVSVYLLFRSCQWTLAVPVYTGILFYVYLYIYYRKAIFKFSNLFCMKTV